MGVHGIVGRERQLRDLDRGLAAARAGHGGLALVEGDAGAGKTALAHALSGRARDAGMRAVWGACLEGEGAPAFRPWTQIVRALGRSLRGANRPQLFDDVFDVLRAGSADQGLLVVVDDLHWADVPSMRLLQSVAAEVPDSRIFVAGLYRGRDELRDAAWTDALRAICRERAVSRMALGPLAPHEVDELARRTLGAEPDEALLQTVQQRSEGNPLFVLELLRLVEAAGPAAGRLPGGIREVIGRRVDRLPEATRAVVRAASVLGREFTTGLLANILDEVVSLDEAVTAGILVVDGHALRFDHVLTQEVLYDELPTTERQRLHARAAKAGADGVDALAHHLRQAAPLGGDTGAEALRVTCEAAERAGRQLAYEHAAFQYRQALALLRLVPGAEARRPELLLALARSEFRSGAVEDAWRSCREAADEGRAAGDATVVADAATVLQSITNSSLTAQIHAMCRDALAMLHGSDPVREARVLAQLAVTSDPFSSADKPGLGHRALLAAEATGDPEARFMAMQARHKELVDARYVLERLSLGERAVRLGREIGRDEYTAWGHTWQMEAFWELGRRAQVDAELAALSGLVEHLREPLWRWRLTMIQAVVASYEGRFDQARALADEAAAIGRRGGHEDADFFHLVHTAHLARHTGIGFDDAERGVRHFVASGPYLAREWLAGLLAAAGRTDEAAAEWDAVKPHLDSVPRTVPEWIVIAVGSAELSVLFGDRATGATIYPDLLPYADRLVSILAHTPIEGPVTLYLGMLATLAEDWAVAESHLRAAVAMSRATGSPPYEAAAELATARLLLARSRPAEAMGHIDSTLRIARRLGMAPLAAEAAAVREAARKPVLSPREHEVAGLVADGLSNRQIAHRLHLSERTAENHVAHILTKLGFDSRARIAAWYAADQRHD